MPFFQQANRHAVWRECHKSSSQTTISAVTRSMNSYPRWVKRGKFTNSQRSSLLAYVRKSFVGNGDHCFAFSSDVIAASFALSCRWWKCLTSQRLGDPNVDQRQLMILTVAKSFELFQEPIRWANEPSMSAMPTSTQSLPMNTVWQWLQVANTRPSKFSHFLVRTIHDLLAQGYYQFLVDLVRQLVIFEAIILRMVWQQDTTIPYDHGEV